jgi:hypothetical protein
MDAGGLCRVSHYRQDLPLLRENRHFPRHHLSRLRVLSDFRVHGILSIRRARLAVKDPVKSISNQQTQNQKGFGKGCGETLFLKKVFPTKQTQGGKYK